MNTKLKVDEYLSNLFIFQGLEQQEREFIAQSSTVKRFNKNIVIFEQGDQACAFYLLVNGKLSVFRSSPSGKEQVIHIHTDGDVVAEAAIFDKIKYPASCKTLKESLLIRIPKDNFISLIMEKPQISLKMMASYSRRLREFVSMVEYLSLDDIKLRLLKYLNKHAVREDDGKNVVRLGVSKKELSQLLGTIPETLSRNIRALKEEGIIDEQNGIFTILSPPCL